MRKKMFSLFLVFMMIMSLIPIVQIKDSNASIGASINKKSVTLFVNQKYQLKLSGTKLTKVASSNKKIVAVNNKGLIKGIKAGKATVSLKGNNNKVYKCNVTVKNPYISKTSINLIKGKSYTLKLYGTSIKSVATSNKKVATISKNGVVKGVKKGSCYISLVGNNKKTYKCKVTVKIPSLSITNLSIIKGNSFMLKVNNTSNKIAWSTSNKSIATVNNKGLVKGVDLGNAIIYAKVDGFILKCNIKVDNKGINYSELTVTSDIKNKIKEKLKTYYIKGIGINITSYVSKNEAITEIDNKGKIIAKNNGTTMIEVKDDQNNTYTCKINVEEPELYIPTSNNKYYNDYYSFYLRHTTRLVKWSVSDTNIAEITKDGVFRSKKSGKVTVSVTLNDYKYSTVLTVAGRNNTKYNHKHTYKKEVVLKQTCKAPETVKYSCTKCNYSYCHVAIKPPSNNHNYKFQWRVEPTCKHEGYDVYLCDGCGWYYTNFTSKVDHEWILIQEIEDYYGNKYLDYECKYCNKQNLILKWLCHTKKLIKLEKPLWQRDCRSS